MLAGEVRLGPGGAARRQARACWCPTDVEVVARAAPRYVSRGGLKLERALERFGIDVAGQALPGRRAPRPAASPTACFRRGAAHVVALDVGYGELDWRIRNDERVTVLERTNARDAAARRASLRARPDRGGRLLHRARQGPAGACGLRRDALRPAGAGQAAVRGSGAAGSARAASCAIRPTAWRRSSRSARGSARARPRRAGILLLRAARARRATARASSGAPRARGGRRRPARRCARGGAGGRPARCRR